MATSASETLLLDCPGAERINKGEAKPQSRKADKQWGRPRARRRNLLRLGINRESVYLAGSIRKGPWRMCQKRFRLPLAAFNLRVSLRAIYVASTIGPIQKSGLR
jgi:hypothetical protein